MGTPFQCQFFYPNGENDCRMMKYISRFILWFLGWKINGVVPPGVDKAIVIVAPHTSNWDFVMGRMAYFAMGIKVTFLIKKEVFFWPAGPIIRAMGGESVDRSKSNNMVDQIAQQFEQHKKKYIVITPEGTRSLVKNWKRGFYFIALKAQVPITLGFLDYRKKEGGIGPSFRPCGDYDKDLKMIEAFYANKTARHPERFNLSKMYQE
jgi:1-acyl-sn-glycerol-3-phosphate acyltransferase